MKDYYDILGVPEDADLEEVRSAFRRLAFQHHPDKNPGNEKAAEEKFKEINEAYSILADDARRQEYDAFRNGRFAGMGRQSGFQGFGYSQQDIFRNAFSNQNIFEEMSRMFTQAGLRYDEEFLNRVFFGGQGVRFQFFTGPGVGRTYQRYEAPANKDVESGFSDQQPMVRKPSIIERILAKAARKAGKYVLKKALGIDLDLPLRGGDILKDLRLTREEAHFGCMKQVRYKRGKENKTVEVTIPSGIVSGNRIKLSGMGEMGAEPGDLYLHIDVG